ncbi:hypothetical protein BGZ63DRAFT_397313 [Mariannaea sp. PMI_226]|nr:hypothetical protein BGZ63DRAFT_397313 [Mariannaea sp. PMI_226]
MSSHAPSSSSSLVAQPKNKSTRLAIGLKTVSGRLRRHTQNNAIELSLEHHYTNKVYSPGSAVSGELHINPKHDLHFDDVRITLLGCCQVRQEDFNNTSLARHTFLAVDMPISPSNYPSTRVFAAGVSHTIPFHFVIPNSLLPTACSHIIDHESARAHHTSLPSSMGDWEKDDMTTDLTQVKYEVVAQILQNTPTEQGSTAGAKKKAVEVRKRVKVLSSSLEAVSLNGDDDTAKQSRTFRKTKAIQKSPFSKPLGHVTLRASQATTICLSSDGREATPSLATVDIEFETMDRGISPPKIDKVAAKLHAHTWYSATPMSDFPDQHAISKHYSTSMSLGVECTDDSAWLPSRSEFPEVHLPESNRQSATYTRTFQLVLTPPTRTKTLLPNFHSCLISRTYKMAISFRLHHDTVTLDIPVTIQAEAGDYLQKEVQLPSFEEALHIIA